MRLGADGDPLSCFRAFLIHFWLRDFQIRSFPVYARLLSSSQSPLTSILSPGERRTSGTLTALQIHESTQTRSPSCVPDSSTPRAPRSLQRALHSRFASRVPAFTCYAGFGHVAPLPARSVLA